MFAYDIAVNCDNFGDLSFAGNSTVLSERAHHFTLNLVVSVHNFSNLNLFILHANIFISFFSFHNVFEEIQH